MIASIKFGHSPTTRAVRPVSSWVKKGLEPSDWKPITVVGSGVKEIRIHTENEYRVMYVAKFAEAVYVLHAFGKKTQQTSKKDIELASQRYRELVNERK